MYENMLRYRVVWGSVSTSLEYGIADWNLAQFALMLGKQDDHDYFLERSLFYRNNFDPKTNFLRPRHSNGDWIEPFDPTSHGHEQSGYTEGSAWTYTFMVPYDIHGLIEMMGGLQQFVDKLQACFDEGYFDVTNEPDIAYPFLFNYVEGEEWRTQRQVRQIIKNDFSNAPDGLPGNDDVGTLSAWIMCAMMGFYPDCPGDMHYQLCSPVFSKITIDLDQAYYPGGTFVIEAPDASPDHIYIRAMHLNGEPLEGSRLHHNQITQGGRLVFGLSEQPK